MTGRRIVSPEIELDIDLKKAWACAQINNCDECQHKKACQKIDDKLVRKQAQKGLHSAGKGV